MTKKHAKEIEEILMELISDFGNKNILSSIEYKSMVQIIECLIYLGEVV